MLRITAIFFCFLSSPTNAFLVTSQQLTYIHLNLLFTESVDAVTGALPMLFLVVICFLKLMFKESV